MSIAEIIASAEADLAAPLMPTPELDAVHGAFLAGMEYGWQTGWTAAAEEAQRAALAERTNR